MEKLHKPEKTYRTLKKTNTKAIFIVFLLWVFKKTNKRISFHRCACVEPMNPSNETLLFWDEKNITASQVNWTMLEVKVRHP